MEAGRVLETVVVGMVAREVRELLEGMAEGIRLRHPHPPKAYPQARQEARRVPKAAAVAVGGRASATVAQSVSRAAPDHPAMISPKFHLLQTAVAVAVEAEAEVNRARSRRKAPRVEVARLRLDLDRVLGHLLEVRHPVEALRLVAVLRLVEELHPSAVVPQAHLAATLQHQHNLALVLQLLPLPEPELHLGPTRQPLQQRTLARNAPTTNDLPP